MLLLLFLLLIPDPGEFCVATQGTTATTTVSPVVTTTTAGGGGVVTTTTVAPVTTTTATSTTTTTQNPCTTCKADQIDFAPANGMPTYTDAMFRIEAADPVTGCSRLTAICMANNGMVAFMEFNDNQGGPVENALNLQTVEAPLSCINGQWYYRMMRLVTKVECTEAPG